MKKNVMGIGEEEERGKVHAPFELEKRERIISLRRDSLGIGSISHV